MTDRHPGGGNPAFGHPAGRIFSNFTLNLLGPGLQATMSPLYAKKTPQPHPPTLLLRWGFLLPLSSPAQYERLDAHCPTILNNHHTPPTCTGSYDYLSSFLTLLVSRKRRTITTTTTIFNGIFFVNPAVLGKPSRKTSPQDSLIDWSLSRSVQKKFQIYQL